MSVKGWHFVKFHWTLQINALLQAALNNDEFVDDALLLVATHNKCVQFTVNFNFGGVAQICCGSNTTIFLPPSRIDVKDILQVSSIKHWFDGLWLVIIPKPCSQSLFVEVSTAVCNWFQVFWLHVKSNQHVNLIRKIPQASKYWKHLHRTCHLVPHRLMMIDSMIPLKIQRWHFSIKWQQFQHLRKTKQRMIIENSIIWREWFPPRRTILRSFCWNHCNCVHRFSASNQRRMILSIM